MSRKRKKKSGNESLTTKLILVTAAIELVKAVIDLIDRLIE